MTPTELPSWHKLAQLAKLKGDQPLAELINTPGRADTFTHSLAGILFDFGKQWISPSVHKALLELATERDVLGQAQAMFAGEKINASEQRAVLHSALRHGSPNAPQDLQDSVQDVQTRLATAAETIRSGHWRGHTNKPISDIVHIGIGGSHLGPELVVEALVDYKTTHLNIHFVANIDANELHKALQGLNPETTLFVVVSKSFGTLETQINANSARSWFIERTGRPDGISRHFIGITSNIKAAVAFGLDEENLFPIWDWVDGRFSLWSAVGIPILLSLGDEYFQQFLAGAREVDEHFASAAPSANVPLLSALYATWNYNFLGAASLAVLSYDERLRLLPDYLQQLEMESNGKSVTQNGEPVDIHTMPILWGGTGTKGQHAYHQLLHQGTRAYTADFIMVARDDRGRTEHHNWLLANALAQSQAMAVGYAAKTSEPHKHVSGNHPTTSIVFDELAPRQLGGLLAVYEHKVFCQGALWDINSFDQWGVELGKRLAEPIYAELADELNETKTATEQDAVTGHLLNHLKNRKR